MTVKIFTKYAVLRFLIEYLDIRVQYNQQYKTTLHIITGNKGHGMRLRDALIPFEYCEVIAPMPEGRSRPIEYEEVPFNMLLQVASIMLQKNKTHDMNMTFV